MPLSSQRRQVFLFVIAVLLPCLVLVALSVRMIRQERELAEKRLVDERRRLVAEIRQELLSRLERIKLQAASNLAEQLGAGGPVLFESPVVLAGNLDRDHLVLPWQTDATLKNWERQLRESPFRRWIQKGEQEELAKQGYSAAVNHYREALRVARNPTQEAYAKLLLARALTKSGHEAEPIEHYRNLLSLPTEIRDEHGVSFCVYAATRLLEIGAEYTLVLARTRAIASEQPLKPPIEVYMLRSLIKALLETAPDEATRQMAVGLQDDVGQRVRFLEQALELQRDFPKLGLLMDSPSNGARQNEPVWIAYGEETWLIGMAPALAGLEATAVAVQAEPVFESLHLRESRVDGPGRELAAYTISAGGDGEPLGPSFPGLRLSFAHADVALSSREWTNQQTFYVIVLILVLGVTAFGAYLAGRDVRRELRLAGLRSQFVSSVTHELKTPLTAIRMFAETLQLGRSANQEMQNEYLETIVNESERLTRLLNNVLDFSNIEKGQKTYHFQPTSLADVVSAAARAMQYPLSQQGFHLSVNMDNGAPVVPVDRDALEQAVLNLVANAVKYSGESREIDLSLQTEAEHVVIKVTDHGVGIDPEQQKRIFEKFYRAPTSENQHIPGTGLGLALVAHIVEAHGGHVTVQSAPGEGSTFSVHLPFGERQ